MLPKVRTALHQAVEEVVKELDSSYEETKRYNKSMRNNNCLLMKRIKELYDQCKALQAEKDCSAVQEENKRLLGLTTQQKEENEVLHRKVNDLMLKLCQAYQKRDEFAEKLRKAENGESVKIAELDKEVAELQKKNDELIEQLKNKAILNSVLARKYEKLQIALNSDIGEAFECELDDKPFEKGYYLRISKEAYDLSKDVRIYAHVTLMKRSDK